MLKAITSLPLIFLPYHHFNQAPGTASYLRLNRFVTFHHFMKDPTQHAYLIKPRVTTLLYQDLAFRIPWIEAHSRQLYHLRAAY